MMDRLTLAQLCERGGVAAAQGHGDGLVGQAGGRVLGVTSLAPTLRMAAIRAYAACDEFSWLFGPTGWKS